MKEKARILKHLSALFYFFRQTRVRPTYFFLSIVCSALAVLFNLLGLRLLVPLLQGLIQGDFKSVSDRLGVVRLIHSAFPGLLNHPLSHFFALMAMILLAVAIKNVLDYTSALSLGEQIRRANRLIREQVIRRYLTLGKSYLDQAAAVTVTHIIVNAASDVTMQLKHLHKLLTKTLLLGAYLAIMLWISWPLTLVALALFPAMSALSRRLVRRIQTVARDRENTHDRFTEQVMNVISCIPLVKVYALEAREAERLTFISDEEIRLENEVQKKEELFGPIQDISLMATLLLMACAMVFLAPIGDAQKVSSYLVFFYVMRMALPHVNAVAQFRVSMAKSEMQLIRLKRLLFRRFEKFMVPAGHREFRGLKEKIDFNHLRFSYLGRSPALQDVSFTIRKGTITAIMGPTGAGKSTLAQLLARFYDCPPGSIFLDGIDIREFSLSSLMDRIAFVSQDPLLFNDTLRANITYGLRLPVEEAKIIAAVRKAGFYDAIQRLPQGLDTVIGDRGVQLSGGEKQRAALARVFLKEAEIFILDEPTSALDAQTEWSIQQAIEEAVAGKTTLIIAHRLSTVRDADQIVVLDDGRIVEQGTISELLETNGRFYEYWRTQGLIKSLNLEKIHESL